MAHPTSDRRAGPDWKLPAKSDLARGSSEVERSGVKAEGRRQKAEGGVGVNYGLFVAKGDEPVNLG